jgi:hypothetical protein
MSLYEKLIVAQVIKKCSAVYGNQSFSSSSSAAAGATVSNEP